MGVFKLGELRIYERSTEEKIAAAERFRQEGNEAYSPSTSVLRGRLWIRVDHLNRGKRNFGLAAVHYRKALLHFDYTFAETEDRGDL